MYIRFEYGITKKRCPDIFKDKKIMFKEHDISFLPDILLCLKESDIIEIIAFNERKIGTLNVKHSHRSPVSVNFITQNEIVLSKELLIKIIACYFLIFEDDEINFLEAFNYVDIVKHGYKILEKRFEAIKRDFILFDTCDRTLSRRLLYDTFYFFHYINVYRHNT
ncbi:hypothetical protein CWI39_0963p0010 [Hamiltosporidium magnivora]|uniref:Uncharacterized protein n=1 Tax=Hamiltosporidium magnivora TaxID=148818 RepID=A0A4Q9L948_9MICR|nr:hypothetical protein CWI39_0963p0010 [Hamiltosporidium magnivora]